MCTWKPRFLKGPEHENDLGWWSDTTQASQTKCISKQEQQQQKNWFFILILRTLFPCIYVLGCWNLELELQTVVRCSWLLGTECRSFGRAASALNHLAFSPVPSQTTFYFLSVLRQGATVGSCLPSRSQRPACLYLPSACGWAYTTTPPVYYFTFTFPHTSQLWLVSLHW